MDVKFDLRIVAATLFFFFFFVSVVTADVETSEPDFSKTVRSKWFVDKTLLIKDFMNEHPDDPRVKIITAPTGFGKSTVIDMLKRFLATPVDSDGKKASPETTDNYRLFCRPKLEICRNDTFVKKHMEQYPVIHIDYHRLDTVMNFDTLLERMQSVIQFTFGQHRYLSRNSSLFPNTESLDLFIKHFCTIRVDKLTKEDILRAFTWLSELLFKHFGRKVIVLADGYDACCSILLFKDIEDKCDIIDFLGGINKSLFKYNSYLEKGLLTGVLRVKGIVVSPSDNITEDYRWLGDHGFSKYYGLTEQEVVKLIKTNVENETKRNEIQREIDGFYNGYRVRNQRIKIYSMWSVIQYFQKNIKATNYWVKTNYFKGTVRFIMRNKKMFNNIKKLVQMGRHVFANVSEPLGAEDIVEIQRRPKTMENVERFTSLLFGLGYLSEVDRNSDYVGLISLQIPNNEIYMEFCNLLITVHVIEYHFDQHDIGRLQDVINLFKPVRNNTSVYESFYKSIQLIIHNSKAYRMKDHDFQYLLFLTVSSTFRTVVKVSTETPIRFVLNYKNTINNMPETLRETAKGILEKKRGTFQVGKAASGKTNIAVANEHGMVIIIQTKFQKDKVNAKLDNLAKEGLCQALLAYETYLKNSPIKFVKTNTTMHAKETIYIGLAYHMKSGKVSMGLYNPSSDIEPTYINDVKSGIHDDAG